MDTIQFTIKIYRDRGNDFMNDDDFEDCHPEIHILINGRNLIDLVQEVERPAPDPLSPQDPAPRSYAGLNPEWRTGLCNEFLGKTKLPRSLVLTCTCFEEACNSIWVRIKAGPEVVTWKDFTSVRHVEQSDFWGVPPVDYSSLGPFLFDQEQYMHALRVLGLEDWD